MNILPANCMVQVCLSNNILPLQIFVYSFKLFGEHYIAKFELLALMQASLEFTCIFLSIDTQITLMKISSIITPTPANTDGPIAMYRNTMDNTICNGADQIK